jgi:hypothetical protein
VLLVADHHLELVCLRELRVEGGESHFRIEFGGHQEVEMRGLARDAPAREFIGVFDQFLGTHLHLAFVVVPDKGYLGDVSFLDHLLDVGPLHLFGL